MTLTFPILPGQGWSVHKKPKFSTIVAPHVSGREVRAQSWQYPLWEFEATFDGLASDSLSYPGLGAQSMQSLMGLFLQCQGQLGAFLYFDPTDYAVASQGFGTGDGATTAFQLVRAIGGFVEPVLAPFLATSLTQTTIPPGPGGVNQYAPNNLFVNAQNLAGAVTLTSATLTGGAADPNGGTLGALFVETATTAQHYASQGGAAGTLAAGAPATFSVYLKQGASRYCQIAFEAGAPNFSGVYANIDMQLGVVTASGLYGAPLDSTPTIIVSAASNGFVRASISTILAGAGNTAWFAIVSGVNNPTAGFAPSYAGSLGNNFTIAFPQVEQAAAIGAPGAYNPTLATPYYGGPIVTRNGVYVDPSAYSVNPLTGVITFTTAPALNVVLRWSGWFAFICRFLDDSQDFEQFMQNLWTIKSVKFQSVR